MSIIKIENITKIYHDNDNVIPAINDVSLTFEEGEFTAIVGPSGSGKTTLLNMLGALDKPTQGKITIDNVNICQLTENQLINFRLYNIGFVFQNYNLIPVLTVRENVEFIMMLQNKSASLCNARSTQLLTAVGLADRIHSRPAKLSSGQQQRVAVARALAAKPKFILADEPTANLDGKSAENLLNIMEMLNQTENITFIFSTHDPRVIKKARRIITLVDGKIDT